MWNGAFAMSKHRDYEHRTFFEHELDNGGSYETQPHWVMVDMNPIDESLFDPSRRYYAVDFTLHTGEWYRYLVPAEGDNSEPEERTIRDTIDQYMRNPVPGGRRWRDYIDDEETPTENLFLLEFSDSNVPLYRQRAVF